jgi:hypothetical protein
VTPRAEKFKDLRRADHMDHPAAGLFDIQKYECQFSDHQQTSLLAVRSGQCEVSPWFGQEKPR